MRILYSHRIQSRDGQSVHLEAMVAALRGEGHEVLVVGPGLYQQSEFGGESRLVALIRARLPPLFGALAELVYNIPTVWRLRQAVRHFDPDIIYERYNLFHLAGTWVARRQGVPLFLEINAPLAEERARFGGLGLRGLATRLEAHVWRSADRVLVVTGALKRIVELTGVPEGRIEVVPNGINLAEYADLPRREGHSDRVILGFVGFVRDWHGLDTVIAAMAAAGDRVPVDLIAVGDGPARSDLERQAAALGLVDRVHLTGLRAREQVPALIAGFDIALQPRVVEYASPLKIFEYMAAGRAIVAPDQENIREILRDGETALLFDPARPEAMWQAILRLTGCAALREQLGSAARAEIVRRDYTWAGNARRVVGLARQSARRGVPTP